MRGGRLNEAKIVIESLNAKRMKLVGGTGRGVLFSGPNMRAKWESLYRVRLMLTELVARNLAGPEVTLFGDVLWRVLEMVSIELAAA